MGLGITILYAEPLEWHLIAIHLEALTIRICSGSEAYMFNESLTSRCLRLGNVLAKPSGSKQAQGAADESSMTPAPNRLSKRSLYTNHNMYSKCKLHNTASVRKRLQPLGSHREHLIALAEGEAHQGSFDIFREEWRRRNCHDAVLLAQPTAKAPVCRF